MALDPKIAKSLLSQIPEVTEFRDFLLREASILNTLEGMERMSPEERAIEVTARLRAKSVIESMLYPLLNIQEDPAQVSMKDFAVDVGDLDV